MFIRAVLTFKEAFGAFSVYQHSDGYPHNEAGVIPRLHHMFECGRYAWKLPRFEAGEAAAGYIAQEKREPGGFRIVNDPEKVDWSWRYVISAGVEGVDNGSPTISVYREGWRRPVFKGTLKDALEAFATRK